MAPKVKRRSKRKNGAKSKSTKLMKNADKIAPLVTQFASVFCPECQGTGVDIEGDSLEKPVVPLSEVNTILLYEKFIFPSINIYVEMYVCAYKYILTNNDRFVKHPPFILPAIYENLVEFACKLFLC